MDGQIVDGEDGQQVVETSELDRILKFARSSNFVQRLCNVCYMAEIAQRVGYEKGGHDLVLLCSDILGDTEPEIRQALAEQLPQLARVFATEDSPEAHEDVAFLLQITIKLLVDDSEEVRGASEVAFSELALLAPHVMGRMELDMLDCLISFAESAEESKRGTAANLMPALAAGIQLNLFRERAVPHVLALARDVEFRVRKALAAGLPGCCKALMVDDPQQTVEDVLLPAYVVLSQDPIWAVRMSCAEGIFRMAEAVGPASRPAIVDTMERLAHDMSSWVRDASLQQLGPLLHLLKESGFSELSPELVSLFTGMADPLSGDHRLCMFCAYNFPAVVLSLGPGRWSELEGAYCTLRASEHMMVRRSLAYSIHELARVLGPDLTDTCLMPAFLGFVGDAHEVRMGVASNLVGFVDALPRVRRAQCLELLPSIVSRGGALDAEASDLDAGTAMWGCPWQLRQAVVEQLNDLAGLADAAVVQTLLFPFALQLARDPVDSVRREAAEQVGGLVAYMARNPEECSQENLDIAFGRVCEFALSRRSFRDRQMFCVMCSELARRLEPDVVAKELLGTLLSLHEDRVVNVRISCLRTLALDFQPNGLHLVSASQEDLVLLPAVLQKAAQDPDSDVSFYAMMALAASGEGGSIGSMTPRTSIGGDRWGEEGYMDMSLDLPMSSLEDMTLDDTFAVRLDSISGATASTAGSVSCKDLPLSTPAPATASAKPDDAAAASSMCPAGPPEDDTCLAERDEVVQCDKSISPARNALSTACGCHAEAGEKLADTDEGKIASLEEGGAMMAPEAAPDNRLSSVENHTGQVVVDLEMGGGNDAWELISSNGVAVPVEPNHGSSKPAAEFGTDPAGSLNALVPDSGPDLVLLDRVESSTQQASPRLANGNASSALSLDPLESETRVSDGNAEEPWRVGKVDAGKERVPVVSVENVGESAAALPHGELEADVVALEDTGARAAQDLVAQLLPLDLNLPRVRAMGGLTNVVGFDREQKQLFSPKSPLPLAVGSSSLVDSSSTGSMGQLVVVGTSL